jgi:hypothetical protein
VGTVTWKSEPDEHDYPAAAAYLSLVASQGVAPQTHQTAKDLLRASRLTQLGADNPHVAADLKKVKKGKPLSPILLVRGDVTRGYALEIADGYHRVCASYLVDENTDIPCRIIAIPAAAGG